MNQTSLYLKLKHAIGRAIADFDLIQAGDRIAVAVSGGKDSYSLLFMLEELRKKSPVKFELTAVNLDAGYPGYRWDVIRDYLVAQGFQVLSLHENHDAIIRQKLTPGTSPCSFCARLRRGTLYSEMCSRGYSKLALGHHQDDFIETLLLNLFYEGSIKAMSAKMRADNRNLTVIRPLVYVLESEVAAFARERGFPIVSGCCDLSPGESRRKTVKQLISKLSEENPALRGNLLHALSRVHPRFLLDRSLWAE